MIYSKATYTVLVRHPNHEHFQRMHTNCASTAAKIAREHKQDGYQVIIRDNSDND